MATTKTKTKKTKRNPFERDKTPIKVQETQRVIDACVWLLTYRVLTFDQWQQLLGAGDDVVKKFRRRLYRGYYTNRIPYANVSGASSAVDILDQKGIDLLKRHGFEVYGLPSARISPHNTIPHRLALASTMIAIEKDVQEQGWEIVESVSEREFEKSYDLVKLPGERRKRALCPDWFYIIRRDKILSGFFVEVDRATENTKTFISKVKCYNQYRTSGDFKKRFGLRGFRVLTVLDAPTRYRLDNLPRVVAGVNDIKKRYWFTHLEDVTNQSPHTAPIWTVAGSGGPATVF